MCFPPAPLLGAEELRRLICTPYLLPALVLVCFFALRTDPNLTNTKVRCLAKLMVLGVRALPPAAVLRAAQGRRREWRQQRKANAAAASPPVPREWAWLLLLSCRGCADNLGAAVGSLIETVTGHPDGYGAEEEEEEEEGKEEEEEEGVIVKEVRARGMGTLESREQGGGRGAGGGGYPCALSCA